MFCFFSLVKASNQSLMEHRTQNMRECQRKTPVQAQLRPRYLQKDVQVQSPCFHTAFVSLSRTLIRLGCVSICGSLTGFIQLRLGPAAPGSSHLLLHYGGRQRGTNVCHGRHLQWEQTELTATQLGVKKEFKHEVCRTVWADPDIKDIHIHRLYSLHMKGGCGSFVLQSQIISFVASVIVAAAASCVSFFIVGKYARWSRDTFTERRIFWSDMLMWPWGCACMWKRDSGIRHCFHSSDESKARLSVSVLFESAPLSLHGFQIRPPQHISNATASPCNLLQENWKNPRCKSVCVGPGCAGWLLHAAFLHLFTWPELQLVSHLG